MRVMPTEPFGFPVDVSLLLLPVPCSSCVMPKSSLLQQPGHKKFKFSTVELIYKAKKFIVPPFTI